MKMINTFLSFFIRAAAAVPIMAVAWLICFFVLSQGALAASLISAIAGIAASYIAKWLTVRKWLKKQGLSRKDYAYIYRNLKEARKKIKRLQKLFFNVRNIKAFKQIFDLNRLVSKIYTIVKKEPKRFFQAEKFFFYHLDSIVELSEKYTFLLAQPVKNDKLYHNLYETRDTLEELTESIQNDLYHILSDDIDHLEFELDVAKHSLKTMTHPHLNDERSSIK
jgi:5-bromo-4-chloroindolyl phosphate hydrolysis protein